MEVDRTILIRQLVPTRIYLDGLNTYEYGNNPFFTNHYSFLEPKEKNSLENYLKINAKLLNPDTLSIKLLVSSTYYDYISKDTYNLYLSDYIAKLSFALNNNKNYIIINICLESYSEGKLYKTYLKDLYIYFNMDEVKEALSMYYDSNIPNNNNKSKNINNAVQLLLLSHLLNNNDCLISIFCTHCGKKIPKDSNFCNYCGSKTNI